jgi:hypothetical protein
VFVADLLLGEEGVVSVFDHVGDVRAAQRVKVQTLVQAGFAPDLIEGPADRVSQRSSRRIRGPQARRTGRGITGPDVLNPLLKAVADPVKLRHCQNAATFRGNRASPCRDGRMPNWRNCRVPGLTARRQDGQEPRQQHFA